MTEESQIQRRAFLTVFIACPLTHPPPQHGVIHCKDAVFVMTSNLASDEIKAASPMLRKVVEETEGRAEEYTRVIGEFNREIHPVLKRRLRRDEFLGRINQIVVFLPLDQAEVTLNGGTPRYHLTDGRI